MHKPSKRCRCLLLERRVAWAQHAEDGGRGQHGRAGIASKTGDFLPLSGACGKSPWNISAKRHPSCQYQTFQHISKKQKKKKKKTKESNFYHFVTLCSSVRSARARPPSSFHFLTRLSFHSVHADSVRSNKIRSHRRKPTTRQQAQTDGEIPGGPPRHVIAEPLGPQQVKVTWQPPDRSLWNGELLGYTISYANLGYRYPLTTVYNSF